MNNVQVKLRLLTDILNEKKSALTQILNICENQEYLMAEENVDPVLRTEIIQSMANEKQSLIEQVIVCDKVFQSTFDSIRDTYLLNVDDNKQQYQILQERIKEVIDMDIKIRTQENKNKDLIKIEREIKSIPNKALKNNLINHYKKNSKISKQNK